MKNDEELEYLDIDENEEESLTDDNSELVNDEKKSETSIAKEILKMSIYLLVVFLLALFIIKFVAQRTVVNGASMEPTLTDGDNLIVNKLAYRFGEPKRFDIIVFKYRYKKGEYYIKRVIGLPGETVRIDGDGIIYINGEVLEENYGKEKMEYPGDAINEITLGEDEYFVLGDNRNNSSDSRYQYDVGNVKKSEIVGKAWIRIFPFNKIKIISHK